MKDYVIQTTEKREGETVFWVRQKGDTEPAFGIVKKGNADFSSAHSILMAINIGAKMILDFCNERPTEEPPQ